MWTVASVCAEIYRLYVGIEGLDDIKIKQEHMFWMKHLISWDESFVFSKEKFGEKMIVKWKWKSECDDPALKPLTSYFTVYSSLHQTSVII